MNNFPNYLIISQFCNKINYFNVYWRFYSLLNIDCIKKGFNLNLTTIFINKIILGEFLLYIKDSLLELQTFCLLNSPQLCECKHFQKALKWSESPLEKVLQFHPWKRKVKPLIYHRAGSYKINLFKSYFQVNYILCNFTFQLAGVATSLRRSCSCKESKQRKISLLIKMKNSLFK